MFKIQKTKQTRPLVHWLLRARMPPTEFCRYQLHCVGVLDGWMYATDGKRAHRIRLDEFGISGVFDGAYLVYENCAGWLFEQDLKAAFPLSIGLEFSTKYRRKPVDVFLHDLSRLANQINRSLPESEYIDVDFLRDAMDGKAINQCLLSAEEIGVPVLLRLKNSREAAIMAAGGANP